MIDTLLFPPKIKIICVGITILVSSIEVIHTYITLEDYEWNPLSPFNAHHSKLNWKSLYITSLTNIIIFACKPIFGYIKEYLKANREKAQNINIQNSAGKNDKPERFGHLKKFRTVRQLSVRTRKNSESGKKDTSGSQNDHILVRSVSIYHYPYFEWIHCTMPSTTVPRVHSSDPDDKYIN